MGDGTAIEWTDATWNPVTGCSVVSPGCTNCYAMKLAGGRLRNHPSRTGLTEDSKAGPVWNGELRFNEQWLDQPLRWKRPRTIFVCAHGDLFHENVPAPWIDAVFAVMASAPQHRFQVLTKRPERAREYLLQIMKTSVEPWADAAWRQEDRYGSRQVAHMSNAIDDSQFPLPNVWLGVSAEDDIRAADRIGMLLRTPAAVRFVSAEPLLSPVTLDCMVFDPWPEGLGIIPGYSGTYNALAGTWMPAVGNWEEELRGRLTNLPKLDWVIVGGESGAGARPMHPDWARSLRDQCAKDRIPFHFKQWGDWLPGQNERHPHACDALVAHRQDGAWGTRARHPRRIGKDNYVSWDERDNSYFHGESAETFKVSAWAVRVGKQAAGRLLDGRTWDQIPEFRQ